MRVIGFVALGLVFSCQAFALEASAGADTVNTSQVGIDAKLNATNTITTAAINQILNCQKAGKLFDPTTNTCIAVDEPLAKKIAACTTIKQFYNQNTGACMASAPDLTSQLDTTNALLNKMLACANAKQFYNSSTGACAGGSASIVKTYVSPLYNIAKNRTPHTYGLGTRDLCVTNFQKGMTSQPRGGCEVEGSPGGNWTLTVYSWDDSAIWCQATCYDIR